MTFKTRFGFLASEVLLLALAGCGGHDAAPAPSTATSVAPKPAESVPVSKLRMNDPGAPSQLVKGFYGVENGWRWTAGHFSVVLKTPPGAAAHGATLTFADAVSGDVLKKVTDQTLTASIGGKTLKSETYTTGGNHTFTADVPADLLSGDTVTVDFTVDKPLAGSAADRRELGLIATSVGIESK
jgi:hypothetical protein